MKDLFKTLLYGAAVAVGYMAGVKLWDEVLEDKVDDLKERLSKKD